MIPQACGVLHAVEPLNSFLASLCKFTINFPTEAEKRRYRVYVVYNHFLLLGVFIFCTYFLWWILLTWVFNSSMKSKKCFTVDFSIYVCESGWWCKRFSIIGVKIFFFFPLFLNLVLVVTCPCWISWFKLRFQQCLTVSWIQTLWIISWSMG